MENNDAEMRADKNHRVEIKLISPQQNIILSQSQWKLFETYRCFQKNFYLNFRFLMADRFN